MIKVLNQYFPRRWAVLLVGESVLILLVLAVAMALGPQAWSAGSSPLELLTKAVLIVMVCQICLHYSDLYTPEAHASAGDILVRLLQALGIASLALALVYWLLPQVRFGTELVVSSVIAMVLILLGWRRGMDYGMRWAHHMRPAGERLLVLGGGDQALPLLRELRRKPHLGLVLVGILAEENGGEGAASALGAMDGIPGVPLLGGFDQMAEVVASQRPHRIVLTLQESQLPARPLLAARAAGICIEEAPTMIERMSGRVALDSRLPLGPIRAQGFPVSRGLRFYQRATSVLGASLGLVALSPVLALVAIGIRLDSSGPIIYRQRRVGLKGRCFNILKFRSMRADAESATGPVWAQAQDPRVTRLGRWLRKLRLDELPQLFNVLQGSMSIVGPRPERPGFVEEFRHTIPHYDLRHSVRPGITGWAQVSRDYGASLDDAREKLEYDLFYIKNLSIWLDLFILFQTTKIVALGRGAR